MYIINITLTFLIFELPFLLLELELQHARELRDLELQHKESSRTLQEHADQLQKKCADLRHHSLGMEDAMRKDTDSKLQVNIRTLLL